MEFALSKENPWPVGSDVSVLDTSVLFILDANNSFEQDLLEQWLNANNQTGVDSRQINLHLNTDKGDIDSSALEALLSGSDWANDSTLVAPLRVAWLPNKGAAGDSIQLRQLVLGDPRRPRPSKGRRIIRDEPERVIFLAGEPGTVSTLRQRFSAQQNTESTSLPQEFAAFVARQAGLVLDLAERRLQGGRYKVPRYVAENLRANPDFKQSIQDLAQQQNKPIESLKEELNEYIKEMVSFPSSFYIDVNATFNKFVLGLGYESEIVYDKKDLAALRKIVREHPSMLLWTHKTYLDGMVIPKVLYDNDFPVPHFFGGANLSFFGLGFLLRRAGAIFIRRSFQDNPLYKLTLRHYIGYLMEKRFPMSWSFEGTRSRLGKLMPPRYGLLKYVLEACHTSKAENIYIVPISISYDLIRDVDEYATEQTGRAKSAESLKWLFSYISSLRKPMGRIYMNIGEPVILPAAPDPEDRLALAKIAFEVSVEANKVTPITLPSLVCMILLGNAPSALTAEEALLELRSLIAWTKARNITASSDFEPENLGHFSQLLDIMVSEGLLSRYDEGPEVVFGIAPDQHPRASYYRNSVIHFFVNKAIIELSLLAALSAQKGERLPVFWAEAERLRDLFKFEFFYAPSEEFKQELLDELNFSEADWQARLEKSNSSIITLLSDLQPLVAHATLLPFIEAYIVVADMLARLPAAESLEEKGTVDTALKYGRQAYLQRRISSEASIGKILFQNAYKQFSHQGLTQGLEDDLGEAAEQDLLVLKEKRKVAARGLHELRHRLDRIKVLAIAVRDGELATHKANMDSST